MPRGGDWREDVKRLEKKYVAFLRKRGREEGGRMYRYRVSQMGVPQENDFQIDGENA